MEESNYNIRIDNPSGGSCDIYLASKVGVKEYDRHIGYLILSSKKIKLYSEFPSKYLSKLAIAVKCYLESLS